METVTKAVILAAGKGTRMLQLTQDRPKPMLPVQGKPILEHILEGLRAAGITEVCVVTGWQAEQIEQYFGDGTRWGLRLVYVRQTILNGTGKAPELARDWVGPAAFLLTYGDILVQPNTYQRMCARFLDGRYAGLVTVTAGEDVTLGGWLGFDDAFRLTRVVEKPSPAQIEQLRQEGCLGPGRPVWYNAGIYLFRPVLFEFTARLEQSPRGEYELTDALSALVAAGHAITGLAIEGRWVDVRDPEVLAALDRAVV